MFQNMFENIRLPFERMLVFFVFVATCSYTFLNNTAPQYDNKCVNVAHGLDFSQIYQGKPRNNNQKRTEIQEIQGLSFLLNILYVFLLYYPTVVCFVGSGCREDVWACSICFLVSSLTILWTRKTYTLLVK